MSSNEEKIARFSQMLVEMKQDYLENFPKKIAVIKQLVATEKWSELNDEYHKLKGTGKTYGFPEISIVCEILEAHSMQNPAKDPELFKKSSDLLERMHQAYQQNKSFSLEQDDFGRSLLALK